jgi:hypothetical protein
VAHLALQTLGELQLVILLLSFPSLYNLVEEYGTSFLVLCVMVLLDDAYSRPVMFLLKSRQKKGSVCNEDAFLRTDVFLTQTL